MKIPNFEILVFWCKPFSLFTSFKFRHGMSTNMLEVSNPHGFSQWRTWKQLITESLVHVVVIFGRDTARIDGGRHDSEKNRIHGHNSGRISSVHTWHPVNRILRLVPARQDMVSRSPEASLWWTLIIFHLVLWGSVYFKSDLFSNSIKSLWNALVYHL